MRKLLFALAILFLIGCVLAFVAYRSIFTTNTQGLKSDSEVFFIPSGSNMEQLMDTLESREFLDDSKSFSRVASLMKFQNPKPGKYLIKKGWSNKDIVSNLRAGRQEPVKLTFNNQRTINDLAGIFSGELEVDSIELMKFITTEFLPVNEKYSREDVLTLFIPNTYQLFWNISASKLLSRFRDEHEKFWNVSRMNKLKEIGLSQIEAYTLASIVQKETLVNDEKPTVAGVYLNRLRREQMLQADPTVVFANGDFTIRRVLNKHLAFDSPYNTYKYPGLPPGPICMPDISSIDAVISPEQHRYLYFCASTDNSGRHVFAKTLVEHNRNANRYRAYLNKERIYR